MMRFVWLCLAFFLGNTGLSAQVYINPLHIPDTLSGSVINLSMAPGKTAFLPGDSTDTYGINGTYLGPTVILNQGDFVQMNVTNLLTDTSTMHWHGMHVSPMDDGGPHTKIAPGATWSPDFTVLDEAATFWYHPHLHYYTALHVYNGAAGMIIVRDTHEAALSLPRTYGVDDFPLIIQDKSFDSSNQLVFTPMNDSMMVNGTLAPYLEVPAQMVRFRLLNASNQRVYNVGFPGFVPMYMIGSDGGLLNSPLPVSRMLLAPGERAEVVVDFSNRQNDNIPFFAINTELDQGVSGGPGGPGGGLGNNLDNNDFPLMEFRVTAPTANPVTQLPPVMNNLVAWDQQNADRTRTKIFDADTSGFPYLINSTPFNMQVINDTVLLDDIEVWKLYNTTDVAHPFHIHDIQFFILELNGSAPPPHLQGKKDVFLSVPGDSMVFITKFTDFTDDVVPYMYHCHNLFHEDAGMMGQFLVVDGSVGREEPISDGNLRYDLYPNPAEEQIKLQRVDGNPWSALRVSVRDLQGRELMRFEKVKEGDALPVGNLARGLYLIQVEEREGKMSSLRLIKR